MGNRKMTVFIIAILTITAIILVSMFIKSVTFTGDNIERLCWIVFFLALSFTGGNAAEWFAKMNSDKSNTTINKTTTSSVESTK